MEEVLNQLVEHQKSYEDELSTLDKQKYLLNYLDSGGADRLRNVQSGFNNELNNVTNFIELLQQQLVKSKDCMVNFNNILEKKISSANLDGWVDDASFGTSEDENTIQKKAEEMVQKGIAIMQDLLDFNKMLFESSKETSDKLVSLSNQCIEIVRECYGVKQAIAKNITWVENNKAKMEEERLAEKRRIEKENEEKKLQEEKRIAEEKRLKDEKRREEERKAQEKRPMLDDEEVARRREYESQRKAAEAEQIRAERELMNPKNWPKHCYEASVEEEDFNHNVGCILSCMKNNIPRQEQLYCEICKLQPDHPDFPPTDEIVSNIIRFAPAGLDKDFKFDPPWHLAIPHCAPRNAARESVIMNLIQIEPEELINSENPDEPPTVKPARYTWQAMHTSEVSFDDPVDNNKYVETILTQSNFGDDGVVLVVLSKPREDHIDMGKKGGRFQSTVDMRVAVVIPQDALKVNIEATIQVQPIDSSFWNDLREKCPMETKNIMTSSPIIKFDTTKRKVNKPITFMFPVPLNPSAKKERPGTSVAPSSGSSNARPKTSTGKPQQEELDEKLRVISQDEDKWKEWKISLTTQKNKDIVTFDTNSIERMKFFVVRGKPEVSEEALMRLAETIDRQFTFRTVNFVLRQSSLQPQKVALVVSPSNRVSRTIKNLQEEGMDDGDEVSNDIILRERQRIKIAFRGNVAPQGLESTTSDEIFNMIYHCNMSNKKEFTVSPIDKYAQKASPCYHGFVQILTKEMVKKQDTDTTAAQPGQSRKPGTQMVLVEVDKIQCELRMKLPKIELKQSIPVQRAKYNFKSHDSVNKDYLQQLSMELGDEWKLLAKKLGFTLSRINTIQYNNEGNELDVIIYEMLQTWVMEQPVLVNKATLLVRALRECERMDLAEELYDREIDLQSRKPSHQRPYTAAVKPSTPHRRSIARPSTQAEMHRDVDHNLD